MTDETTARDRAIRVVAESLEDIGRIRRFVAQVAVDALLASPEALRALAGAPTADVAGLAEAERWARKYALYAEMAPSSRRMVTLMAEYDERGRERDAARAEVERLRRDVVQHEATIRYLVAERERARARDEAAKAAVQWWREIGSGTPTEKRLRARLNALARAHETEGQDR